MNTAMKSCCRGLLCGLVFVFATGGYAVAADQFTPASINAFFCLWRGNGVANGFTFGVDVKITPAKDQGEHAADVDVQTYGIKGIHYNKKLKFMDGKLVAEGWSAALQGANDLKVKFDAGEYRLTCK